MASTTPTSSRRTTARRPASRRVHERTFLERYGTWLLIAYLVFTLTLVIQRKQAAWNLSLGMASLVVPVTLILWQWASALGALAGIALGLLLFLSIRGARVRAWFSQP